MVILAILNHFLDMFKTHLGEQHPDALYLKSSGLSATLSYPSSEVHKRAMLTEDAVELVRQWENIKAEALGPTHQVSSLFEVLDESMLVQWQTLAQTAKAKSCYWRFVLLRLEVLRAHIVSDGISGEMAEIEALLEEAAELVDESQPRDSRNRSHFLNVFLLCGRARTITDTALLDIFSQHLQNPIYAKEEARRWILEVLRKRYSDT